MMNASIRNDPTLITFPPSLDSELARFLLRHYGVENREERHTLIFSSFATLGHGATVVFPLLYGDSIKLVGPRAIAEHYDARCASDLRLLPQQAAQRTQVDSDWTLFNQTLAFATARFAYYHLLPHRDLMIAPLSQGSPDFEVTMVRNAYPLFAGILQTLLWLTAKHARQSLEQIREVFKTVDSRLATNQNFLVGDELSLSDLAFAVAAAPVVLPPTYGGPIPSLDEMPAPLQAAIREMRAHPAGAFALRIYDEQRGRFAASGK
jgi:glutathione S-transferase